MPVILLSCRERKGACYRSPFETIRDTPCMSEGSHFGSDRDAAQTFEVGDLPGRKVSICAEKYGRDLWTGCG